MMRRSIVFVTCAVAGFASLVYAAQSDAVFDAMQSELQRSMTLTLNELDKPYYLSYTVDDEHTWSGVASLGGLINSNSNDFRVPRLRIRVGDYKFDNTNWTGANAQGPRYNLQSFPIEDGNPLVLRQYLWLATDSAFKGSLQSIARKRAALRNVTVSDSLPDFDHQPAFVSIKDYTPAKFDRKTWDERIRRVSAVLNDFPGLRTSSVEYSAVDSLHRFVDSEGTKVRVQESMGSIEIQVAAQASDGMIVRDMAGFYTRDPEKMFAEEDLTKSARTIGAQVLKISEAPVGDNYTGPILFEGEAAPQLLAELLGRNLHITRKPITAPGAPAQNNTTDLEGRRGVRIMPEIFDVTDDPTAALFGNEEVDDEGVPDKPMSLVEKGVLKDFLRTRQPVRGYSDSNGHARLNGSYGAEIPLPTNLIVKARETSTIPELKQKLLDLIQQRGLDYGIIVRKLDFPSSAGLDEARKILSAAGTGRPISIPLYIYRLYPDGHEELIRGERFKGMNARSLKDILAAGNDSVTFNYLENGAPFALIGFGSGSAQTSIVSPSLLIDDLELVKVDDELPQLPLVPPPAILSESISAHDTTAR